MTTKHEGISVHRLPREPLEAAYAEAWKKKAPTTLGYLLCGQERAQHDYSQRDATVAATIIQWLGSPVGSSFVEEVREAYRRKSLRSKSMETT
jgi:hypothetical protein